MNKPHAVHHLTVRGTLTVEANDYWLVEPGTRDQSVPSGGNYDTISWQIDDLPAHHAELVRASGNNRVVRRISWRFLGGRGGYHSRFSTIPD
ncbi:MAG: hypothetical protein KAU50_12250 [Candidatus Marinimicrobia bacterium]|nr:hypothetical protein [Candidatus Neomarinimicrobiota bacterium]